MGGIVGGGGGDNAKTDHVTFLFFSTLLTVILQKKIEVFGGSAAGDVDRLLLFMGLVFFYPPGKEFFRKILFSVASVIVLLIFLFIFFLFLVLSVTTITLERLSQSKPKFSFFFLSFFCRNCRCRVPSREFRCATNFLFFYLSIF